MARVLVTGGAGFVGSHLVEELLKKGHTVVVMDDLSGGFEENIPSGAELYKESIVDSKAVDALFVLEQPEYVFHLAAYAAEGLSSHIKRFNYMNNLIGSVNLINASVNFGVKRFVFTSSVAVYGDPIFLPVMEVDECHPVDSYGIAKLAVERELQVSSQKFGLDYTIFRPHNVYGERQNIGDKYRNVVGIFMNQLMRGEPMTIFGDGLQRRQFTYVGDVVRAIVKSIDKRRAKNEIFNIGGNRDYSVKDLAVLVNRAMGGGGSIKWLPDRDEVKSICAHHCKVQDVLGVTPKVTLEEGLKKMATWAKAHGSQKSKPFKHIEIVKNLPEVWK